MREDTEALQKIRNDKRFRRELFQGLCKNGNKRRHEMKKDYEPGKFWEMVFSAWKTEHADGCSVQAGVTYWPDLIPLLFSCVVLGHGHGLRKLRPSSSLEIMRFLSTFDLNFLHYTMQTCYMYLVRVMTSLTGRTLAESPHPRHNTTSGGCWPCSQHGSCRLWSRSGQPWTHLWDRSRPPAASLKYSNILLYNIQ